MARINRTVRRVLRTCRRCRRCDQPESTTRASRSRTSSHKKKTNCQASAPILDTTGLRLTQAGSSTCRRAGEARWDRCEEKTSYPQTRRPDWPDSRRMDAGYADAVSAGSTGIYPDGHTPPRRKKRKVTTNCYKGDCNRMGAAYSRPRGTERPLAYGIARRIPGNRPRSSRTLGPWPPCWFRYCCMCWRFSRLIT